MNSAPLAPILLITHKYLGIAMDRTILLSITKDLAESVTAPLNQVQERIPVNKNKMYGCSPIVLAPAI